MIISASRYSLFVSFLFMLFWGFNIKTPKIIFPESDNQNDRQSSRFAHDAIDIPNSTLQGLDCYGGTPTPDSLFVPSAPDFFLQEYETSLFNFILRRQYADMGWCVDDKIRDTGPWIKGNYYGIHPAVRIYYSPRMMYWLTGEKAYWPGEGIEDKAPRSGTVPEGAMIIKEMFTPPADLYAQLDSLLNRSVDPNCNSGMVYDSLVNELLSFWAIMIKTDGQSKDDWFWVSASPKAEGETFAEAIKNQLDDYDHILNAGLGLYCLRCHASAADEYTFSDVNNISGKHILEFRNDNSWRNHAHLIGSGTDSSQWNGPLLKILNEKCLNDTQVRQLLLLPQELLPWNDNNIKGWKEFMSTHQPAVDPAAHLVQSEKLRKPDPLFLKTFPQIKAVDSSSVRAFPMQWADHVVPGADGPEQYITSDNCLGCHGGLGGDPYDIAMFIKTGPNYGDGFNVSEYGEWRWSPMGLAGRDPIFYAQLESEMNLLKKDAQRGGLLHGSLETNQQQITNVCTSCHGSMGQRQLIIDAQNPSNKHLDLDPNFNVEYMYLTEALVAADTNQLYYKYHKYGELGREGISCLTCHHIDAPNEDSIRNWRPQEGWVTGKANKSNAYYLFHNTTGQYNSGPADKIHGPLDDVKIFPMDNQMGITPEYNEFIGLSQMCGSCHSINLPNIGMKENKFPVLTAAEQNEALKPYNHSIEQATFLEWQNSDFASDEDFKSCQDCHMPGGFKNLDGSIDIHQLTTKIATIQDRTYPEVFGAAGADSIGVTLRDNYKRHEHVGLNVFLLEMFDQFPEVLGVAKQDYMTSAKTGNALAIENMIKQAKEETIDLKIEVQNNVKDSIDVLLTITNLTGHRFPSGVAFRRAFLEVTLTSGNKLLWGSGRTNKLGVIIDQNNKALITEFLPDAKSYQHHHQIVRRQDQVQIYEELNQNVDYEFTTSFVHRVHDIKDNRLLPKGYQPSETFRDKGQVIYEFMQATDPNRESVAGDTCYIKPPGKKYYGRDQIIYRIPVSKNIKAKNLSVKATMYSQAIPPYWLKMRFSEAPEGKATQRLYYMTSQLNLEDTYMKDWKLPLVTKELAYDRISNSWCD